MQAVQILFACGVTIGYSYYRAICFVSLVSTYIASNNTKESIVFQNIW